jgi:uncharacterized membrane protein YkvA (DUF1232 family)
MLSALKTRAHQLKQQTLTVYFAARDPRTPFWVRLLAGLVTAYALSPIDLIPDFIPVIGFLDDIILIPLGLAVVIRNVPPQVMESARRKAHQTARKPVNYYAAVLFIALWLSILWWLASWILYEYPRLTTELLFIN